MSWGHVLKKRSPSFYGIALTFLVAAIAVVLAAQGWRSRVPTFDLLTYIHSARDLLAAGALPEYGDTSSLGAFSPPGTAWLLIPGELLFDDPRVSEYVGAAILNAAGLLGLFLLARKYFTIRCACVAVLLYGLSATGIFTAGALWPVGRPEFLIWMVYLASHWVTRQDARYLAAAFAVWGAGMYVDMAITPAVLILPALWWIYRSPVHLKPVLVAAALVGLIWFPYLRFEAPHAFADIRSQLLFNYILPADYTSAWCNPGLTLRGLDTGTATPAAASTSGRAPPTPVSSATTRSFLPRLENAVDDKLLSNFAAITQVPGRRAFSAALFLIVALSVVLLSVTGGTTPETGRTPWRRDRSMVAGFGMLVSGALLFLVAELLISRLSLATVVASAAQTGGKLLAVAGVGLMAFRCAARVADLLLRRAGVAFQSERRVEERRLLVVSLLVPWLTLVAVAEPDKPERFWWLWPLQVLFLAAFATDVLPRLRPPQPLTWATIAALAALLVVNGQVLDRISAWHAQGWSGREAPEVRVVDYVADQLDDQGKQRAAIGYRLFIYRFMAAYHIKNADYKVGSDFDLLFKYRRGVSNIDSCAEGFSDKDQYRIARMTPPPEDWAPRAYFDVGLSGDFILIREIYPYRIYKRIFERQ